MISDTQQLSRADFTALLMRSAGFQGPAHTEYDPYASRLFIAKLACALAGRVMTLHFRPGFRGAEIYGGTTAREGEVRELELPGHPFFIGTLFVPRARSRKNRPHPLVTAFLHSVACTGQEGAAGLHPAAWRLRGRALR